MLERFFQLQARGTTTRTEVIAGFSTFLTAGYIIFVNPSILGSTGMDKGALVTVTCLISGLATLAVGLWPKAPIMMAPGMGLNAFFAFAVCQSQGVPWPIALGIVFYAGLVFWILSVLGICERIVNAIPRGLRLSISVGIGLFIAFIGLSHLGIIGTSESTLVTLGALSLESGIGLLGLFVMAALEQRGIRGSIIIGILITTVIAIFLGRTPLPEEIISMPKSIRPIAMEIDLRSALSLAFLPVLFTFLYVDIFDSLGTLIAVSRRGKMVREDGTIRHMGKLLQLDGLATMVGALFGTSTVTTYVESAVGISQGGRSGLTSVVIAGFFLVAMFFAPLVLAVPAFATAPALILVGLMMVREIQEIRFDDWEEALPAFLAMILMPLTYSISNGIMFGFLAHVVLKVLGGKWKDLNVTVLLIAALSAVNLLLSL